jgi:hypothetical protein
MLILHGDEFKNHILGAELRDRLIHDIPFSLYYFGVILRYYLPWSFFFLAALAVRFLQNSTQPIYPHSTNGYFLFLSEKLKLWYCNFTHKDNQAFLFSIIWLAFPLLFFTLFRIEHSRYMLPVSAPIVMITAQFLSKLTDSPNSFQSSTFKVPFYLALTVYLLIFTLTVIGIFFLSPHFSAPTGLIALSFSSLLGAVLLFVLYKSKKYLPLIIALSIVQLITLTSLSGESLSYFNRYPMKKFANHILNDSQLEKRIGLYRLGNHRARMGVMTGLPSVYLKSPVELRLFIKSEKNIYVIMRQSDLKNNFHDLPMTITATDTAWKKIGPGKDKIVLLLKDGLTKILQEYSERYVLLKN